jgi:hypothetical protein
VCELLSALREVREEKRVSTNLGTNFEGAFLLADAAVPTLPGMHRYTQRLW